MIEIREQTFFLSTQSSSYWFRVTPKGHLEHLYYGPRQQPQDPEAVALKRTAEVGSCVAYDEADPLYCLEQLPLEWSGIGRGDFRHSPAEIKMPDGSFCSDFLYQGHELSLADRPLEGLPSALGASQTLSLRLGDSSGVALRLHWAVFEECDVIARWAELENLAENPLVIRRLLSMSLDVPNRGYDLITLDGGWAKEAHVHRRPVAPGMYVNASTTGGSSNKHNPGFLLAERGAGEDNGLVYAFNLVYSGNHYGFCELSEQDLLRVGIGINPHCFEWELTQGGRFTTPQAVMTLSPQGLNGVTRRFGDFVNRHIVRGEWQGKERPVLFNNWEACFFRFTRGKLWRLAKSAKKLGAELFVLDDGWFGKRDSDTAGLGDYSVNRKKLPRGLEEFAKAVKGLGMDFGLWFEPECVNEDSDLFRAHSHYALGTPGKAPTLGRHQRVLDLTNPDVRAYIIRSVGQVLDSAGVDYVKWDMNRHISDAFAPGLSRQGEFFHRYVLGLYDVLEGIFSPRPHILLESCSSGGNRFDLGMLCFSPQIWASDNTDPVIRQRIQGGLSLLYPLSTIGAHVTAAPHQQTLRATPLSTRFNTACFGVLGYELDLKHVSREEKKEIREQIAFYKVHRRTFQYGRFRRNPALKPNQRFWQVAGEGEAVVGFFQEVAETADSHTVLPIHDLEPGKRYRLFTKPQRQFIKRFGGLVKHILPVNLNPEGAILRWANALFSLPDCEERYEGDGALLGSGVLLNNQFMGSYYNPHTELLGDFGSYLFVCEEKEAS
ncbi:MAG: alpha-galactosidase [Candidatus Limiplasma sp.]|nr:alpha-galactosidase [Candidatus Limiplasma sp.]